MVSSIEAAIGDEPAWSGVVRSSESSLLFWKCRRTQAGSSRNPKPPVAARWPGWRGDQHDRSPVGGARFGCAGSTDPASRPRCSRIRSMTAGASMLAMTRKRPPHWRQVSMSMANTRLRRCAQVIARCRSVADALAHSVAAAARILAQLSEFGRGWQAKFLRSSYCFLLQIRVLTARGGPCRFEGGKSGAGGRIRTADPRITNALLYRLSYTGNRYVQVAHYPASLPPCTYFPARHVCAAPEYTWRLAHDGRHVDIR